MEYLILAIITSTIIFVLFKFFGHFRIDIAQAITVNYLVATLAGYFSAPIGFHQTLDKPWILYAVISGVLLLVTFIVYAVSTQKVGIAITSVSGKMSVVIPVLFGFLMFHEVATWMRITGIVLALAAFYMTLMRTTAQKAQMRYFILPLLLFIGNGCNDSLFKIVQGHFVKDDYTNYLTIAFFISLVLGLIIVAMQILVKKKKVMLRSIIAGIILGLLNWYSTYFFLVGMRYFDVSVFVPLFNMSIVVIAALIGFLFYREKLSTINILGILLAVISIVLISGIGF